MVSATVDRRMGLVGSVAMKVPCRAGTTANITLSGLQTIDGVTLAADDRVLVKNQTSSVNNGIYDVSSSDWTRSKDFDGNLDIVKGTMVRVTDGTTLSDSYWAISSSNPITIGTSTISFTQVNNSLLGVSSFIATLLDDTTAQIARTTLSALGINLDERSTTLAGTDTYTGSMTPTLTSYAQGLYLLKIPNANGLTTPSINLDSLGAKTVVKEGANALLPADMPSNHWGLFRYDGTNFILLNPKIQDINTFSAIRNLTLSVSMAASAATIAIKTQAAADATSSTPITIPFRNSTAGTGTFNVRTISAALSTVISSGSTGGTTGTVASRIWIAAIDNAGTVEIAWINVLNGTNITAVAEEGFITTTAEGGAGAADSAGIWYSTTARSNVAYRLIGYFESTQAVAGTWATSPSKIQLFGPGVHKPGDIVQLVYNSTGAVATGATAIPNDDTIPQITEGDQYMTQAITPTSPINILEINIIDIISPSAVDQPIHALFQDAIANALVAWYSSHAAGSNPITTTMRWRMVAGLTSSTTFRLRVGSVTGATLTFNGFAAARKLGGAMGSSMTITEIFT